MKTLWIVVADASRAIVLSRFGSERTSTLLKEMNHPAARLHTVDLVTDQRGRVETQSPNMHSAAEPHMDAHKQEAVKFAHEICKQLDDAAKRHAFDGLVLIAPPHFLGLLQARLGKNARNLIAWVQSKDLIHASLDEIDLHLNGAISPVATTRKGQDFESELRHV